MQLCEINVWYKSRNDMLQWLMCSCVQYVQTIPTLAVSLTARQKFTVEHRGPVLGGLYSAVGSPLRTNWVFATINAGILSTGSCGLCESWLRYHCDGGRWYWLRLQRIQWRPQSLLIPSDRNLGAAELFCCY